MTAAYERTVLAELPDKEYFRNYQRRRTER